MLMGDGAWGMGHGVCGDEGEEAGEQGAGELGSWGDEFFPSVPGASSAQCPMPNAQLRYVHFFVFLFEKRNANQIISTFCG
jgi:hypothetical protein